MVYLTANMQYARGKYLSDDSGEIFCIGPMLLARNKELNPEIILRLQIGKPHTSKSSTLSYRGRQPIGAYKLMGIPHCPRGDVESGINIK